MQFGRNQGWIFIAVGLALLLLFIPGNWLGAVGEILFPLLLLGLGWLAIKTGKKTVGWVFVLLGGFCFIDEIFWLLGLAAALLLIAAGWVMLKNRLRA